MLQESAKDGLSLVHIVDDDSAVRDSLCALLESYGYDVQTYSLAREFLGTNPKGYSGCLVADLHMPEMNGIELIETLRTRGTIGAAVVMTGRGDSKLRELALKAGAYTLLDKPVDVGLLRVAIEDALSRTH